MKVSLPSMGIERMDVTEGTASHLKYSMKVKLGLRR